MTEAINYALVIAHAIESLPLSRAKRQLLSKITDLDIAGRLNGFGGCYAKNKTLGEEVGLAETTVSKYIREMRRDGYIKPGKFHGHYRILNSSLHNAVVKERYEYNLQKHIAKNTSLPSTNFLESPERSTGAAPYVRTGDYFNNQSTNKTNNKERIQPPSLSEITWGNIFEHSKNLVLEGWGEYDHNPEKESSKIRSWKKLVPENPGVVLETLRKLIHIRKSEEYKTHRFWGTIPINIASTYSYKDIIKNTYNLLTEVEDKASSITENKEEIKNDNKINQQSKHESEPTWEGFLIWAGKRLTKSSFETLKQIEVKLENEEIRVLEEIPESLHVIVEKYFTEEVSKSIPVKFTNPTGNKVNIDRSEGNNSYPTFRKEKKNKETESFQYDEFLESLTRIGQGGRWNMSIS
ncbi:DNA-binding helix-turn-helix protein [Leptospira santarosai str. HAI134]|uniref:winged helix-turn-helix transcriptional regulator n=1 Tax=Leptospira santarosai TaxID=28183 RepID=UPI0002BF1F4D|nr:winged helix-turn-helix transcriptional regulator [Leptospira santarosai]EMO20656.1 DNA-binding helix-turn-helix protein [Leptospira santarosai str. HAI134]